MVTLWHTHDLQSYHLNELDDIMELIRGTENVLEWGVGERKEIIKRKPDEIDARFVSEIASGDGGGKGYDDLLS